MAAAVAAAAAATAATAVTFAAATVLSKANVIQLWRWLLLHLSTTNSGGNWRLAVIDAS